MIDHLQSRALNRRNILKAGLGATLGLASGYAVGPAKAAKVLRLGHSNPQTSHHHLYAARFAELVKARTNGEVEIQIYPSGQLGGNIQQAQAVRTGTQDAMLIDLPEMTNTIKDLAVFDVPYVFDNVDQGNKILQSSVGQKFLDLAADYQLYALAFTSVLDRNIMSRTKAVHDPKDLRGMKIRVLPAKGYIETMKGLGAIPTPIPYAQVYLALQQGTVDGGDMAPDQAWEEKFVEVFKYYTLNNMQYPTEFLIINKALMDGFPKDIQDIMRVAAKEAAPVSIEGYRKNCALAFEDMKKRGIQIIEVQLNDWKKATEPVRQSLASEIPNGEKNLKLIQSAA